MESLTIEFGGCRREQLRDLSVRAQNEADRAVQQRYELALPADMVSVTWSCHGENHRGNLTLDEVGAWRFHFEVDN